MDKKQYNNIIDWTLKHDKTAQTEDSVSTARAVFNNMGVALPQGDCAEIADTLKSNDYMGWRECTAEEAQAAANNGFAAIAIDDDKIIVIGAEDDDEPLGGSASVMTLSPTHPSSTFEMRYYVYSNGDTTVRFNNDNYNFDQILTDSQINLLLENRRFYEEAERLHNVPWKILAAIHYRETKLRRYGPDNGDGPYQIWGRNYPIGFYTDSQFQTVTNDAAAFIKEKAGGRDLYTSHNNVKYVLFAYNGRSSEYIQQALDLGYGQEAANRGEGSPYVMNRYDAYRDPTVEPTKSNRTWGQIKTDNGPIEYPANTDFGAYVIYNSIKE